MNQKDFGSNQIFDVCRLVEAALFNQVNPTVVVTEQKILNKIQIRQRIKHCALYQEEVYQ